MKPLKPLLAATVTNVANLDFPLLISPKLDGIRALVIDGVLLSRSLKNIPNLHVQSLFGRNEFNGFDGELICGDPTDPAAFRKTTSAVMSKEGKPNDVQFHVFDNFWVRKGFKDRFASLKGATIVPHHLVHNEDEVLHHETRWLAQGYEGVMLRDPEGPYKFGRSTLTEGILMKLKRFSDDEARIIGIEEQMQNNNEMTRDALGRADRSNHKENMLGKNTLGSLRVVGLTGPYEGVEFSIGTGMDDAIRAAFWKDPPLGQTVKFKYFPLGSKDAPRFPVYLGVRHD